MTQRPFVEPVTLMDLSPGTGIAIWAFRSCAMGMTRCDCLPRVFTDLFGDEGPITLRHILVLAQVIGHSGRKTLSLTYPNSQKISHDEASLLRALQAAQLDRIATVEAQLHWLMAGATIRSARDALMFIADQFARHDLPINDPHSHTGGTAGPNSTELSHRILRYVLEPR